MNLFYLALIGHGLSLTSLFISLGIFFHFKCVPERHLAMVLRRFHVPSLFLQEFELSKDHASQEPLLLLCSELAEHHYLVDGGGKRPRAGAEESSGFIN